MDDMIPVAAPALWGNEKRYVGECLDSTWISSIGRFIGELEKAFALEHEVGHAMSCSNGTVALHLCLLALGVGPGDEVLVPSLTYVATANAVRYCGAEPIFVDSDLASWNLDPEDLARKLSPRTKAIIAVHLYGKPAPMQEIMAVARAADVKVVEDVAEAVGARYQGRPAGSIGHLAAFSFFGNKILTSGEGGMVVTDDPELAARVRQLKGQGQDPQRRYWFPVVGYNYRMTNIQAAIALAQLEKLDEYLARRDEIAAWYCAELEGNPAISWPASAGSERSVCWLFSVVLGLDAGDGRDQVMAHLQRSGIETRPFFYPCHTLPPYAAAASVADCPRAEWLSSRGLSLPTWVGMTREHARRVASSLLSALEAVSGPRGIAVGTSL